MIFICFRTIVSLFDIFVSFVTFVSQFILNVKNHRAPKLNYNTKLFLVCRQGLRRRKKTCRRCFLTKKGPCKKLRFLLQRNLVKLSIKLQLSRLVSNLLVLVQKKVSSLGLLQCKPDSKTLQR